MERQDKAGPLMQFTDYTYTYKPLADAPSNLGPNHIEEDCKPRIFDFWTLNNSYDDAYYYSSDTESEIEFTMVVIERKIKVVTEQHNIDKPAQMEGFPMKEWTIEIYVLDQDGKEHPATCFTKVIYNLHPSFEQPVQTYTEPPFKCTNEGWGEFEMTIDMYTTEKGGKTTIPHDLNFAKPTYENIHKVLFKNPSMALQAILRETGPVPTDEERKTKKVDAGPKNKKRIYDIEKMAEALPQCEEDDLLQIIQMIHDGKTDNTFVSNNVDAGEFSVDLYTLPEDILVQLWELLVRRGLIN